MSEMTTLDLTTLRLERGAHFSRTEGVCLMEAVAWLGGESHTDAPACASPVLSAYGRALNDALDDDARQRLVPLAERIVGTAGRPDLDQRAALMAADWIVRTYTPTWLRLAGLIAEAESLEGLAEVRAWDRLLAIQPHLDAARSSAATAWAAVRTAAWAEARVAAWDAVRVTARDAAEAAAWDAVRDAVRDAVEAAAEAAVRDAAEAAAWNAAWAAVRVAVRDVAEATAWAAVRVAVRDAAEATAEAAVRDVAWTEAWAAAWDTVRDAAEAAAEAAVKDALRPTVERLQVDEIALYERMVALYEGSESDGE